MTETELGRGSFGQVFLMISIQDSTEKYKYMVYKINLKLYNDKNYY